MTVGQVVEFEQFRRDKSHFFQEPCEKQPADKSHCKFLRRTRAVRRSVFGMIGQSSELGFAAGPGEPIYELAIEATIEFLNRQDFLPCIVKLRECADCTGFFPQAAQRKTFKEIQMSPVRLSTVNITNE